MRTARAQRHTLTTLWIALLLTIGAGLAATAQQEGNPQTPGSAVGTEPMMEEGMMAMHQEMRSRMEAMDSRLGELVAAMEAASGERKTDAVAAVVAELVAQRRAMHGMMMKMQPRMMGHMMEHMASGMARGTMQSMADCPMMKKMSGAGEESGGQEHLEHHPKD